MRRRLVWAAVVALAVALAVAADVAAGGLLARLDAPALRAGVDARSPGLTPVVRFVTDAGGWAGRLVLGAAVAVPLALRARRWTPVLLTAGALAGAPLLSGVAKRLVDRTRPAVDALLTPPDPSFPSGHATGSVALSVVLAGLLLGAVSTRAARAAVLLAAGAFAVAVGLSRVYLGAHWLTDVLAGWALGAALGLALLALSERRRAPVGPRSDSTPPRRGETR